MRIPGKRIRRTRLVRAGRYVVALDVEMVYPEEDPSEPCYEPETVRLLGEATRRAEDGDVAWLRRHGAVYELMETSPA